MPLPADSVVVDMCLRERPDPSSVVPDSEANQSEHAPVSEPVPASARPRKRQRRDDTAMLASMLEQAVAAAAAPA
eukprot:4356357-Alexandrium_andersonii.AAC.1